MKTSFIFLTLIIFLSFCAPSFAQSFNFDQPQDIIVSSPGFYAFSDEANASFKELLKQNGSVAIIIKNFNGKGLKVAPAADNHEIGRKKKAKRFGLSFVPQGMSVSLNLEIQPFAGRPCPSPVSCQDDCGGNLGKCCEKDSGGSQSKICVAAGTSSCGCGKR